MAATGPTVELPSIEPPLRPADLLALPPSDLTFPILQSSLADLPDREAFQTAITLLLNPSNDIHVARHILRVVLPRVNVWFEQLASAIRADLQLEDSGEVKLEHVEAYFRQMQGDEKQIEGSKCAVRVKELEEKCRTYAILAPSAGVTLDDFNADAGPSRAPQLTRTEIMPSNDVAMEIDDPWADHRDGEYSTDGMDVDSVLDDPWETKSVKIDITSGSMRPPQSVNTDEPLAEPSQPPVNFSTFLSNPVSAAAFQVAALSAVPALKCLKDRYPEELFPYRLAILEALPSWTASTELDAAGLLPAIGSDGLERQWTAATPDRDSTFITLVSKTLRMDEEDAKFLPARAERLTAQQLSEWYSAVVESLDSLGLLDAQLAWVQHGASLGVPSLDALGEDLSLLSRLVYDSHFGPIDHGRWSLASWRQASETEIVRAYLQNSTVATVVSDIRRLVLPYLYVLESRAERASKADSTLADRLLHDALLTLPLDLTLPIFESSKATLPAPQRLLKNDLDVARIALACLYGSDTRDEWAIKSAIFECLPVWDVSGGDLEADREATSDTLDAIATFVRPQKAGDEPAKSRDLFIFFHPLPFKSLSRALDVLDVHLESGEILARWDTPVQLRFLLQSARDRRDQLDLAEKMVRRQSARGPHNDQRWSSLWGDMLKLNGGDDALLRGALGMLNTEDMMKVYLGGLLASGKFDIAKRLIRKLELEHGLRSKTVEDVALSTSREFYENAESGNLHTGDMKLAYDCLATVPASDAIRKERDFIEATSRLSTFSIPSPSSPSHTITPFEIRQHPNKLELIRTVLATNPDAFRHSEIILELADKLGYRGYDRAKVSILSMLADAASSAEEWEIATTHSEAMISLLKTHSKRRDPADLAKMRETTYQTVFALGSNPDFPDIPHRMTLLGQALEYCCPEKIPPILDVWRKVEEGQMKLSEAAKRRRLAGIAGPTAQAKHLTTSSVPTSPASPSTGGREERVLGSRTAARAAKMALDLRERFNIRSYAPPLSARFRDRSIERPASRQGVSGNEALSGGSGGTPGVSGVGSLGSLGSPGAGGTDEKQGVAGTATAGLPENVLSRWTSRGSDRSEGSTAKREFGDLLGGLGALSGAEERTRDQAKRALARGMGWLLGADEREVSG